MTWLPPDSLLVEDEGWLPPDDLLEEDVVPVEEQVEEIPQDIPQVEPEKEPIPYERTMPIPNYMGLFNRKEDVKAASEAGVSLSFYDQVGKSAQEATKPIGFIVRAEDMKNRIEALPKYFPQIAKEANELKKRIANVSTYNVDELENQLGYLEDSVSRIRVGAFGEQESPTYQGYQMDIKNNPTRIAIEQLEEDTQRLKQFAGKEREGFTTGQAISTLPIPGARTIGKAIDAGVDIIRNRGRNVARGVGVGLGDYVEGYVNMNEELKANQAIDQLDKKLTNDEELTTNENLLMKALAENSKAHEQYDHLIPDAYKVGESVGQSLGFMGEFAMAGGGLKTVGKKVLETATKTGAKKYVGKFGVNTAVKLAQAGVQTTKMPSLYKSIAENVSNGSNFGEALLDAYWETGAEVLSERIFLRNPVSGGGAARTDEILQRMGINFRSDKGAVGIVKNILEEASEEKINEVLNAPKDYDKFKDFWDDFTDWDRNKIMLASVALMTGSMGSVAMAGNSIDNVRREGKIKRIVNAIPSDLRQEIDVITNNEDLSAEQQVAMVFDAIKDRVARQTLGEDPATATASALAYANLKLEGKASEGATENAVVEDGEITVGEVEKPGNYQEILDYLKDKGVKVPDDTTMEELEKLYNETKKAEQPTTEEVAEEKPTETDKKKPAEKEKSPEKKTKTPVTPEKVTPPTEEKLPKKETEPTEELPKKETEPTEELPKKETEPTEELPKEETSPTEELPKEETSPTIKDRNKFFGKEGKTVRDAINKYGKLIAEKVLGKNHNVAINYRIYLPLLTDSNQYDINFTEEELGKRRTQELMSDLQKIVDETHSQLQKGDIASWATGIEQKPKETTPPTEEKPTPKPETKKKLDKDEQTLYDTLRKDDKAMVDKMIEQGMDPKEIRKTIFGRAFRTKAGKAAREEITLKSKKLPGKKYVTESTDLAGTTTQRVDIDDIEQDMPELFEYLNKYRDSTYDFNLWQSVLAKLHTIKPYQLRGGKTREKTMNRVKQAEQIMAEFDGQVETMSKKEFKEAIDKTEDWNPKQKEIWKDFVDSLNVDRLPVFDPKANRNYFRIGENLLGAKDPDAFAHEIGHWAYANILTPQERLEFLEMVTNRFVKPNKSIADELATGRGIKISDKKMFVTNVADSFNEYFAEQFSQYVMSNKLPENQVEEIFERLKQLIADIVNRIRNKDLINPDMVKYWDKLFAEQPKKKQDATTKTPPTEQKSKQDGTDRGPQERLRVRDTKQDKRSEKEKLQEEEAKLEKQQKEIRKKVKRKVNPFLAGKRYSNAEFKKLSKEIADLLKEAYGREMISGTQYRSIIRRLGASKTDKSRKKVLEYVNNIIEKTDRKKALKDAKKAVDKLKKANKNADSKFGTLGKPMVDELTTVDINELELKELIDFTKMIEAINANKRVPNVQAVKEALRIYKDNKKYEKEVFTLDDYKKLKDYLVKLSQESTKIEDLREYMGLLRKANLIANQAKRLRDEPVITQDQYDFLIKALEEPTRKLTDEEFIKQEAKREKMSEEEKERDEMRDLSIKERLEAFKEQYARLVSIRARQWYRSDDYKDFPKAQQELLLDLTLNTSPTVLDNFSMANIDAINNFLSNLENGYLTPFLADYYNMVEGQVKNNNFVGSFDRVSNQQIKSKLVPKWVKDKYGNRWKNRLRRRFRSRTVMFIEEAVRLISNAKKRKPVVELSRWIRSVKKGNLGFILGDPNERQSFTKESYNKLAKVFGIENKMNDSFEKRRIKMANQLQKATKGKNDFLDTQAKIGMLLKEMSWQQEDFFKEGDVNSKNASINEASLSPENKKYHRNLTEEFERDQKNWVELFEDAKKKHLTTRVNGIEVIDTQRYLEHLRKSQSKKDKAIVQFIDDYRAYMDSLKDIAELATLLDGRTFIDKADYFPFMKMDTNREVDSKNLEVQIKQQFSKPTMQASATRSREGKIEWFSNDVIDVMGMYTQEILRNAIVYPELRTATKAIQKAGVEQAKENERLLGNDLSMVLLGETLAKDLVDITARHYNEGRYNNPRNWYERLLSMTSKAVLALPEKAIAEWPINYLRAMAATGNIPSPLYLKYVKDKHGVYGDLVSTYVSDKFFSRYVTDVRGKIFKKESRLGKVGEWSEKSADWFIVVADKQIGRPLFVNSFEREFKAATGKEFDAESYSNNIKYRINNADAVHQASSRALTRLEELFNTKTMATMPQLMTFFGGLAKWEGTSSATRTFNFVQSFARGEAQQMLLSAQRIKHGNAEQRVKGVVDLLVLPVSNAFYTFARTHTAMLVPLVFSSVRGGGLSDWEKERLKKVSPANWDKIMTMTALTMASGGSGRFYGWGGKIFGKIVEESGLMTEDQMSIFYEGLEDLYYERRIPDYGSWQYYAKILSPVPSRATADAIMMFEGFSVLVDMAQDRQITNERMLEVGTSVVIATKYLAPNGLSPTLQKWMMKEKQRAEKIREKREERD